MNDRESMPDLRPGLQYEAAYESALGRMLVRFNDLEVMVGRVQSSDFRSRRPAVHMAVPVVPDFESF